MATATGVIDHVVRPHVALTEDKYLRGPASAGPGEAFLPATMPPGVARIVTNVLALFAARDMAQHCTPMPMFARDVVWDAPPFLLSRKGSVRVSAYFLKFFARQRFVPSHIEVRRVGQGGHLLEVSGTLEVFPHRTLLLPGTLLLPSRLPIRATLLIGVNGPLESGEVELVVAKWHNLPGLPNFMRAFNGVVFGTVPHLLEPIWSYVPEFIGDDFYKRRREATFAVRHPNSTMPLVDAAKDVVGDTATGVMDYGVSSVRNIGDGVSYLWSAFMEAAGFAVGRARAYTGAAVDVAQNVAGQAFGAAVGAAGTAANVAGTAVNVASSVAGSAANAAASAAGTAANVAGSVAGTAANAAGNVAGKAYETAATAAGTAAGAAEVAYDTAATAANRTYDTAATAANRTYVGATNAANRAYEAGTAAADSAYEAGREGTEAGRRTAAATVDRAAFNASLAAEDARRGYEMGKAKPVEVPAALAPAGVTSHPTSTY